MTTEEFNNICAYLNHNNRRVLIEVELRNNLRSEFEAKYNLLTNGHSLPNNTNEAPYYVWPDGANKWGVELRLYFISDANIPNQLENLCVNNNRPGYEEYDKRINNNDLIYSLFERGFVLGTQI